MIVSPEREKFIKENFFEFSFEEKEPDFEKFKTLNSAEQFYLAEIYNWDDGTQVLNWIVESEKCDKGTASMIFWRSSPDYYFDSESKISEYDKETFELLKKIVERFRNKNFKNSKIKYNPSEDFEIEDYDFSKWNIPKEMTESTNGFKPIFFGTLLKFLKNKFKKSQRKRKRK